MMNCPVCDVPNPCGLRACQVCNASLIPNEQSSSETFAPVSLIYENEVQQLMLSSINEKHQLLIQLSRNKEVLCLGRSSPSSKVDVDLTEFGAVETGVSRLHAQLIYDYKGGAIYLKDLNSMNGTFINSLRLSPNIPLQVRDGDQICFGRLKLRLHLSGLKK